VAFTTVCVSCGKRFRLLDHYRDCKIMCSDCRKPFIARRAREDTLELDELPPDLPTQGWLVVCPSCGHTQVLPDDGEQRVHCVQCASALAIPRTASKKIRKKEPE
jgi:ribosomal protein S27E